MIVGLNNSGKTSIVLNLMGKVNLMNFFSLSPTLGADIVKYSVDNSEFSIWDLGGQAQYRKDYLKNFTDFFEGANKLIYVIDIQDIERYELALDYLKLICQNLKKHQMKLDFNVFLHKLDPNIKEIVKGFSRDLVEDIIKRIQKILPDNLYTEIYETTIFTTFEKKLII